MSGVLREILAKFGVEFDAKELQKGHKQVESTIGKLKELGEVVVAAFALEKIAEFGKELLESAETLKVTSLALGTTTGELQGLDHAAQQSGVGVEELHAALSKLQRGAADAATKGASPVAAALKKLHVPLKDASGEAKTSGELFTEAAQGIAEIKNPTERAGIASALFGRSYARILPVLLKGKEGIAALSAEVGELGFGMDEAFIENSEDILHNVDRLKKGIRGIAIQAIGPLLPGLVKITEEGVAFAKSLVQGIKHTEALKTALLLLTGKGLVTLISKLGGAGGLIGILRTLGSIALRTVAPFLILEDVFTFLTGGKSVTGDLLEKIFGKGTAEKVRKDIEDIWVALKQGAQDAIKDVKQQWEEITKAAKEHAGQIAAVVAGYGLYRVAVVALKSAQIAYRAVLVAIAAAQKAYAVAMGIATAAMGLFEGATLSATAASIAANVAMGPLIATLGTAALAVGALVAAYAQLNKLKSETGGLGFTGIVTEMVKHGTFSPAKAVDDYQNEEARKEAAARNGGVPVAAPGQVATAPIPGPVTNNTTVNTTNKPTINVNVPPGTPKDMAHEVGDAAQRGVQRGIDFRAAHAALVPQAG